MAPATDPTSLLTAWLQRDKKLVTYRLLSRELRIHVDDAKTQLAAFYKSNKDKSHLDATYILIGTPATAQAEPEAATTADEHDEVHDGDDKPVSSSSSTAPPRSFLDSRVTHRQTPASVPRQVIRLVSADDLEQARSSLEHISSCHIYSISPGRLRDATQLTAVQHDLHTQQKYADTWQQTNRGVDLGVIVNPNIKDNYDPSKAIPSLGAPSAPALPASSSSAAKSQIKQESDTKTTSTTSAAKPTTAAPPASSATGGGKKGGLDWSRAKPKESESKPATAVKKEAPSSTKRSSARKALLGSDDDDDDESSSKRKPILIDDDDDDEDDDGKPEKLGYADDDDDDDVQMVDPVRGAAPRGTGKRADARSQSKAQQAAQRKELEAMMDSDADDDDEVQVVEPSAGSTKATGQGKDLDPDVEMADSTVTDTMNGSASAPAAAAKRRVRKKRKIGSKKVRTKDERGYTVTKTVDEYESYSSDESDAPVVVGSKRASGATKQKPAAKETIESRSTSTSASASPAPTAAPAKSTPAAAAASNNSSGVRKPSGGATSTPAKKGQQSLNSFFTRKPKDK
ncbi:conserved hypothetical protein [Sporisorium reilianum SRZ2]|uniref:DNA polymerase delta subunit 3 n=1 Tax=Sporisorium reilianum (strain SRZ2) TaxID=999809 RepID=E6ZMB9_SPORE|nr:conserved hypothetical protein [Sporisorium reilianum SRZ2]